MTTTARIPLKKQFPIKDGWLHAKLSLKRGSSLTEEEAKEYIQFFYKAGNSPEFGHIDVSRNPVTIVYRETKAPAVQCTALILLFPAIHEFDLALTMNSEIHRHPTRFTRLEILTSYLRVQTAFDQPDLKDQLFASYRLALNSPR